MHVHTVRLAALARRGMAFPDHGEELAGPGSEDCCAEFGIVGKRILGGRYLQFFCADCDSTMFECNTELGMRHARKVLGNHKATCCLDRQRDGLTGIWPGRDEE